MKLMKSNRGTPQHILRSLMGIAILAILGVALFPNISAEAAWMQQAKYKIEFSGTDIVQVEPETAQAFPLTINISPVVSGSDVVTVEYQTVNGSATGGSDFTAVASEVITFTAATGTSQTINITILPDTTPEDRENFFVQLKNPVGDVTLGAKSSFVVNIETNDPLPTSTPTSTPSAGATAVYIDQYEGNDTLETAYSLDTVFPSGCTIDNGTFWPAGDVDYYRFWAQGGATYTISSAQLSAGLDTVMTLYDPQGKEIATNDDFSPGQRTSSLSFTPANDAWHFLSLINEDPSNPAGKTYCVEIKEVAPTASPTPVATATFVQGGTHDACKSELSFPDNDSATNACVISANSTVSDNFVPREEGIRDVDYYRIWVKAGNYYQCDTLDGLAEFNDTKLKFLNAEQSWLAENDNFDATTAGSQLEYLATYTGWMYVLVEPAIGVEYRIADKYTYTLTCSAELVTPTFTPAPVQPSTGSGGGGVSNPSTSTPTPTLVPQPVETIDVLATVQAASTPTQQPTPLPVISINPLPTAVPPMTPVYSADLQVVLFYDRNQNNLPEIDEGIVDMAVLAKDSNSGQLLALGYTNEAGLLRFQLSPSAETMTISIPYLGINQTVSVGASELLIRVAPSTLPSSLP